MHPATSYREFAPGPELAGVVECFWTSTAPSAAMEPRFHRVLPDNGMDLLFDFTATGARRARVIGTMTRPLAFRTSGAIAMLGIRFRPGGLPSLIALHAADLTDDSADLAALLGRWAVELWHRLGEAPACDRVRLAMETLRTWPRRQPDPFVRHCVQRIEAMGGDRRIAAIENGTGLSARQIERRFAEHVGITPKTFARVVRFRRVVETIESAAEADWARLAAECGFSDQSHLVREFRALSGLTPTEYRPGE